jgi:hypothetical protein
VAVDSGSVAVETRGSRSTSTQSSRAGRAAVLDFRFVPFALSLSLSNGNR